MEMVQCLFVWVFAFQSGLRSQEFNLRSLHELLVVKQIANFSVKIQQTFHASLLSGTSGVKKVNGVVWACGWGQTDCVLEFV